MDAPESSLRLDAPDAPVSPPVVDPCTTTQSYLEAICTQAAATKVQLLAINSMSYQKTFEEKDGELTAQQKRIEGQFYL